MKKALVFLLFFFVLNPIWAQYKLYEEGIKKYNTKDYYGAIELFSDFLTRQYRDKKFDADSYYWRGMSAYLLKEYSDAHEDFKQSVALNHPKKGNAYWLMARCAEYLNQFDGAVSNYTNALSILSSDQKSKAEILAARSSVYTKLGNSQAAIKDIQQALAIQPSNEDFKQRYAAMSGPVQPEIAKTSETLPEKSLTTTTKKEESKTNDPLKSEPVPVSDPKPSLVQQNIPVVPTSSEPPLEELYKNEKRFALVIGNSNYSKSIGALKNPVNDASDFAEALKSMNFDVTLVTDASYGKIRVEMMKFREKLNNGNRDETVGLFYYAGHGLQYENENYIVPVDAEIQYEDDISRFCFPIQKMVLSQMETTNSRMNIVILDACRNNPFPVLHRSIGENAGLGEMKKARGAFIAYATSPGSVASDGNGRNGLYTQELIKAINKPNRTIEQVFKEVRANVLRQSGEKQNPWENSNIIGDFYFQF